MNQQEFEPQRQQEGEFYRPHYPYSWSDQTQQEGLPRDEPPMNYAVPADHPGEQSERRSSTRSEQVPWWARPQSQRRSPFKLLIIVALVILLALVLGMLGLVGLLLGGILKIVGAILGVIFALSLFFVLLIVFLFALIIRAISRAFGPFWQRDHRAQHRSWRSSRRWS